MYTFSKAFDVTLESDGYITDIGDGSDDQGELAEIQADILDENASISRTGDTIDGLLVLESLVRGKVGTPTKQEVQLYALAGRFAVAGTAMESDAIVPAFESYEQMHQDILERVDIATESVLDSLANAWESFSNFMKKFFNKFRSYEGKLSSVEKQIEKISGYGGKRNIKLSLPIGYLTKATESLGAYMTATLESIERTQNATRSTIERGLSFSTTSIDILKALKQSKEDQQRLLEDAFEQYVDIFGESYCKDIGLKKKNAHASATMYVSETNLDNQYLEVMTTTKVPRNEPADIYLRGVKSFSIGMVEGDEEVITKARQLKSWDVSASDLSDTIKRLRKCLRESVNVCRNYEKVHSKFSDLIHTQKSMKVSTTRGSNREQQVDWVGTAISAVGAVVSYAQGYNDINRLNSEIGRAVTNGLIEIIQAESHMYDKTLSILELLAFDRRWHTQKDSDD